jgi:hypothetical protein
MNKEYTPAEAKAWLNGYDSGKAAAEKWQVQSQSDYEAGFIAGAAKQMESSVDKAVNAISTPSYFIPSKDQKEWVGLTDAEIELLCEQADHSSWKAIELTQARLKEKNL